MTFDMTVMMICSSDDEFGNWSYLLYWHVTHVTTRVTVCVICHAEI